jgi:hypothetical protein
MTSATTPKTIALAGPFVQKEGLAGGAIKAGMLIKDVAGAVVAHDGAGLTAAPAFAFPKQTVSGEDMTEDYASGDQVIYGVFSEGAHVYAYLASGQNVSAGALLQSNGSGYLSAASTADNVVARARESVNASGGAARIKVEVVKGYTSA